ncbi:probable ATP-dependent RNA helicase DDX49 [Paramuricea clavata]|uniref:Probable ATP-dependent RNA helicase DDX49 n=1 Tax=Paramuricea clavata TaxID=317549 RepID=A0A7D9ERT1_PARCT|nr:probable ATP-dependent RNA helicase DDX49 [Paramuricea clavata]
MADNLEESFGDLGIKTWLVKQCSAIGIKKPTEIQAKCIPEILKGRDCIGCAKTGSGKTAVFALTILQHLSDDPFGVFALILTPTRELAFQIGDQFKALGKPINLQTIVITGGMDMMTQSLALAKQPHVVIATPGRCADHLTSTDTFNLRRIKYLVLDEADRLLEDTFAADLEVIFSHVAEKRQTLLFSATLNDTIEELCQITATDPFCYSVQDNVATVAELDQRYLLIPDQVKDCYMVYILREHTENKSVIVFTKTCYSCQVLAVMFRKVELPCVTLHSLMSQSERLASLAKFKTGIVNILVATDVASRGLDIPEVELVLNTNVPRSPDDYIHRVGRTARAGRGGLALTLLTQYDIKALQSIEERIGVKLASFQTTEKEVLRYLKGVSVAKREAELRVRDSGLFDKRNIHKQKRAILEGRRQNGRRKKKKV